MVDLGLALGLFLATLLLVIWQPGGLKIGTTAMVGALVALGVGVVSLSDVWEVTGIVWDATLAFIGIILVSMALDKLGFFEWAAIHMAHLSGGNGHLMFVYTVLLGSVVAAFFANDGAALILTPIILAKMRLLQLNFKALIAFVLAAGFISDAASMPFIFSNLTNIVTAHYFDLGFMDYAAVMWWPNWVAILSSTTLLWWLFRKEIPQQVPIERLKLASSAIRSWPMFRQSLWVLLLVFAGIPLGDAYGWPVSVFALTGAVILLVLGQVHQVLQVGPMIKAAPWQIVWFSIGLYVVVWGLKNAGLTELLASGLADLAQYGHVAQVVGTGFMAAILSALMNNMPTIMVMDIALGQAGQEALAYANIIGSNLGPKMTPWGSLATLLWLHVLMQKGVTIGWGQYMKMGLLITPPILLLTLLSLAWVME